MNRPRRSVATAAAPRCYERTVSDPNPSATALRVSGLVKGYSLGATKLEVLRGVDLDVPAGQMCAVMGPSGVGKSTLLNCIAGLDVPDAGAIHVLGQDMAALDDE